MNEDNLDFVTDSTLRKIIEESMGYVQLLRYETKKEDKNTLYKEETYRVIVLYIVSIIEAILLYLYKKQNKKITYTDYKFISPLGREYRHARGHESPVVVAVQKIIEKDEQQIGIPDLVSFFREEEKDLMKAETVKEILKINNLRNTLHLSKPRDKAACDIRQVEAALGLLVYIIKRAPKSMPKKR